MNNFNDENIDWSQWLEKPVCVKGTLFGTLRYFGKTHFRDGLWCGIELDKPVGRNNGTIENVTYFTCCPNFGIFVPVCEVSIFEKPKPLNSTFTNVDKTFDVQNFQAHISPPENSETSLHSCNVVDKLGEIKERLSCSRTESEESLGILDPSLIEDLETSFESFKLDATIHNVLSNCEDFVSKKQVQDEVFIVPNLLSMKKKFSDEISNPKYASTPRHPQTKRFVNFNDSEMDLILEDINKTGNVFESPCHLEPVFFDEEKFKNDPSLTSTSKALFESPTSPNLVINHRVEDNTFKLDNLNKTQVLSLPLAVNEENDLATVDLNKTKTVLNKCDNVVNMNSTEVLFSTTFELPKGNESFTLNTTRVKDTDFRRNMLSQIEEVSENYRSCNLNTTFEFALHNIALQHLPVEVSKNSEPCLEQFNNINQNFSIDSGSKSADKQFNGVNENDVLEKTFVLDSNPSEILNRNKIEQVEPKNALCQSFERRESFDYKSKFLDETACSEKSLSSLRERRNTCSLTTSLDSQAISNRFSDNFNLNSTFHKKGNACRNVPVNRKSVSSVQYKNKNLEKVEFKKPLSFSSSVHKSRASVRKPAKEKTKISFSREGVATSEDASLISKINLKTSSSCADMKSNVLETEISVTVNKEDKFNRNTKFTVKSALSHRLSYSKSSESTKLSSSDTLPLTDTSNKASNPDKWDKKIIPPFSRPLSTFGLKPREATRVSLSMGRKSMFEKRINEKIKEPEKKPLMLQLNRQSRELPEKNKPPISRQSIGCFLGTSSNRCAIPKRKSLALSSVKTSLPVSVTKPRNSLLVPVKEKSPVESVITEAVQSVNSSSASLRRSSRQVSSLPLKNQVASIRKVGLKYEDVKEGNDANPKIPRYNLRGKS